MMEFSQDPTRIEEQQLTRTLELSRDYYEAISQLRPGQEALYLGIDTGGSWLFRCVNNPATFVDTVNLINGSVEAIMLAVPGPVHVELAMAPFQNAA